MTTPEHNKITAAINARAHLVVAADRIAAADDVLNELPETHGARLGCNALTTAIAAIRLGLEAEFLTPAKETAACHQQSAQHSAPPSNPPTTR